MDLEVFVYNLALPQSVNDGRWKMEWKCVMIPGEKILNSCYGPLQCRMWSIYRLVSKFISLVTILAQKGKSCECTCCPNSVVRWLALGLLASPSAECWLSQRTVGGRSASVFAIDHGPPSTSVVRPAAADFVSTCWGYGVQSLCPIGKELRHYC